MAERTKTNLRILAFAVLALVFLAGGVVDAVGGALGLNLGQLAFAAFELAVAVLAAEAAIVRFKSRNREPFIVVDHAPCGGATVTKGYRENGVTYVEECSWDPDGGDGS